MNTKLLFFSILAAGTVFLTLVLVSLIISNIGRPKQVQVPKDFSRNYSNLNKIVPGKDTIYDVERVNGLPFKNEQKNGGTYLYYKTPTPDYTNTVFVKNGVVLYALENVFGEYRGKYDDYVTRFGQPNLHLYNKDGSLFDWFVFLQKGVAIESSNNEITAILYFVPQDENDFMGFYAKELFLSKSSNSTDEGEQLVP